MPGAARALEHHLASPKRLACGEWEQVRLPGDRQRSVAGAVRNRETSHLRISYQQSQDCEQNGKDKGDLRGRRKTHVGFPRFEWSKRTDLANQRDSFCGRSQQLLHLSNIEDDAATPRALVQRATTEQVEVRCAAVSRWWSSALHAIWRAREGRLYLFAGHLVEDNESKARVARMELQPCNRGRLVTLSRISRQESRLGGLRRNNPAPLVPNPQKPPASQVESWRSLQAAPPPTLPLVSPWRRQAHLVRERGAWRHRRVA